MTSRLLALAFLVVATSCTKTLEGPTPQVTGAANPLDPGRTPAAVCNAQGAPAGWRIDLSGEDFAPIPIDVLTPQSGVRLPVVSLSGPETYELPRDRVFFTDKTRLTLRMPTSATSPAKELVPGLYTLTVANPNERTGTLEGGLRVVPPPTLTSVTPVDEFSQTQPTTVRIVGTGFRQDALPQVTLSGEGLPTVTLTGVTFVAATEVTAQLPAATQAGTYDVTVTNPEGCAFTLVGALNVQYARLGTLTVDPRFGWQLRNQSITIYNAFATPTVGFTGGAPRVFIVAPLKNNPNQTVDIPLRRVAFVSANTLTGVVPDCSGMAGTPVTDPACPNGIVPGTYALKIRDPGGPTGDIPASRGFTVVTNPPPSITSISPSAINTGGLPSSIANELVVSGQNFGTGARVQVVFQVPGANGQTHIRACTLPAGTTAASDTTLSATVPTSLAATACTEVDPLGNTVTATGGFSIAAGLYVIRVQNADDPAYADFSGLIVTNPAANPEPGPVITTRLVTARADFPLVQASDDLGQNYLYAIGGTDGTNVLSSVEVAPVTLFGDVGGDCGAGPADCRFRALDRTPLGVGPAGSTTAEGRRGVAAIARTVPGDTSYIYVIGGQLASGETNVVERAQVLRQADAPEVTPSVASGGSLAAGTWYYRVSAIRPATDTKNPGGETLPSDLQPVTVPQAGAGRVTLSWPCSTAARYRIYRTATANAASGTELLLREVDATAGCSGSESFVDDGTGAAPAGDRPLPQGALGKWVSAGLLSTKRAGAAARMVNDQLYVAGGFCSTGAGCVGATANGVLASVDAGAFTGPDLVMGAAPLTNLVTARRRFSLSVANALTAPNSFSQTSGPGGNNTQDAWLLAVGGDQGPTLVSTPVIEVAKVRDATGVVAAPTFAASGYSTAATHGGWSEVVANLIIHAGTASAGGFTLRSGRACPGTGQTVGQCTSAGSFSGTLNAPGTAGDYRDSTPRFLAGEVLFRAYIYVAGGFPNGTGTGTPSATLERFIY